MWAVMMFRQLDEAMLTFEVTLPFVPFAGLNQLWARGTYPRPDSASLG
jgi:hypothetical protein